LLGPGLELRAGLATAESPLTNLLLWVFAHVCHAFCVVSISPTTYTCLTLYSSFDLLDRYIDDKEQRNTIFKEAKRSTLQVDRLLDEILL